MIKKSKSHKTSLNIKVKQIHQKSKVKEKPTIISLKTHQSNQQPRILIDIGMVIMNAIITIPSNLAKIIIIGVKVKIIPDRMIGKY
jgi:hypothetical protein